MQPGGISEAFSCTRTRCQSINLRPNTIELRSQGMPRDVGAYGSFTACPLGILGCLVAQMPLGAVDAGGVLALDRQCVLELLRDAAARDGEARGD